MKKFIIIGNPNAISYKDIFTYIQKDKLWIGSKSMGTDMLFRVSDEFAEELKATKKEGSGYKIKDGKVFGRAMAIWYTNIENQKRNTLLDLYKRYSNEYIKYDNFNAINVDKVCDIPKDYDGIMGVPISFLDKYCPAQFEIVGLGITESGIACGVKTDYTEEEIKKFKQDTDAWRKGTLFYFKNGKAKVPYARILIRKRKAK